MKTYALKDLQRSLAWFQTLGSTEVTVAVMPGSDELMIWDSARGHVTITPAERDAKVKASRVEVLP